MVFPLTIFAQVNSAQTLQMINEAEMQRHLKWTKGTESYAGNNINIIYQRMEWIVNPEVKFITGTVTTLFITLQDAITSVSFDMSDNLIVADINYHGQSLGYDRGNNILTANLPVSLQSNITDSLTILYSGIPDPDETGSFVQAQHDSVPIIWTLSEPYGAKDWWPCKQTLIDKIDSVDIFVTAPQQYKVASIGLLISENINGAQVITHWKHRHPVAAYLVAIAITNYVTYYDYSPMNDGDTINILNYVYPESLELAQIKTPRTIEVMQLFDSLFIKYPFADEKYGHTQFGQGGGMEHQTMTFTSNFDHEMIAHELAHQWFGDYITCKSWSDIWLNEGFAVYLTGLTYEYMFGSYYWMPWKTMQIDDITSQPDGAVFVTDTGNVERLFDSRLTYHKAGMLLNMLRWELGNQNFFEGINNYLSDTELENGYSTTEDIKYHLEEIADTTLTEFFSDWLYGEGYPQYTVNWVQNISDDLEITVFQQSTHPSVSFFEMSVPLLCKGDNADTILRLHNTYSGQHYEVHLPYHIDSIVFDPEKWLVTKDPVVSGIDYQDYNRSVFIFPNPVRNCINIYWNSEINITKIEVCDITGKKIFEDMNVVGQPATVDIFDLKAGVYNILITTVKKVIVKPFVKI